MRLRTIIVLAAVFTGVLAGGPALFAQDFSGSVETGIGWYWTTPELMPIALAGAGKVEGKIGNPDAPTGQYSAQVKVSFYPATVATSLAAATVVELKEAWVKLFAGPFDISVGNQIVAWGSTDVVIPTDVVNPQDLTLPVDPIKMPAPLARVVLNLDWFTLDLVAQPLWFAGRSPDARWLPGFPAGLTVTGQTLTNNVPDLTWDNVAFGGRMKASIDFLQGLDLAVTFYRGKLPTPRATVTFALDGGGPGYIASTTLDYDRVTLFGADFVLAIGEGFVIKSEWGYKTFRDTSIIDPGPGLATLQGVSGVEWGSGPLRINAEYVLDWTKGAAGLPDTVGHSLVAIVIFYFDVRANLKVTEIHNFSGTGGGMIAPQFTYTIADGLEANAGLFFFYGDPTTTYGTWWNNSFGRVWLKYSF